MPVEPGLAARLLSAPAGAEPVVEPFHTPGCEIERVSFPGVAGALCLRRPHPPGEAENEAAVLEALQRAGFAGSPPLLAVSGQVTVTPWLDVPAAIGHRQPTGAMEAAVDSLAALHSLQVREGLRWGLTPGEVVSSPDLPLHRLGFASPERDLALPGLAEAREALLGSSFGFGHGSLTAAEAHVTPGGTVFVSWGRAGFGPQLHDLIGLLWTLPLDPRSRAGLIRRYATARSMGPGAVDLTDLLALRWSLEWLMALPRRLVESLGDDLASDQLHLVAATIERSVREPVGGHPAASAIRGALWG